jgi:hypothetical protein
MILTENVMDTKVEKVVAEPAVRAPNPALAAPTPRPSSSAQKPHMMNPSNRASDTVERYHESYDTRDARGVAANSQWVGLFFFAWVELWCIFVFLTIVAFLYGIF